MSATLDSTPVSLPAAGNLSTKTFRFGKNTATGIDVCSVAGEAAAGVIGSHYTQNPVAGDAVDFYIERLMLVEAGGVVSVDDDLTTDALGRAVTAGAGDVINGKAIDAATAAGQFIRMVRPFAPPLASTVADAAGAGGSLVVFTVNIADAASGDTDVVMADKVEVLDILVQKRAGAGGAADTLTVKSTADAISNAIDTNIADKTLARATTIDDAHSTIAAGGKLRFSVNNGGAGNAAMLVTVVAIKRA